MAADYYAEKRKRPQLADTCWGRLLPDGLEGCRKLGVGLLASDNVPVRIEAQLANRQHRARISEVP